MRRTNSCCKRLLRSSKTHQFRNINQTWNKKICKELISTLKNISNFLKRDWLTNWIWWQKWMWKVWNAMIFNSKNRAYLLSNSRPFTSKIWTTHSKLNRNWWPSKKNHNHSSQRNKRNDEFLLRNNLHEKDGKLGISN